MSAKRNVLGQLITPLNSARHSELVGFAVLLVTCSIAMIQLGHGQGAALAAAAYIAACVVALYVAARLWTCNDRAAIVLIVVTAIAMRVPAFMQPPMLSHDAYRYVWDGKLVLDGIDPRAVPPLGPAAEPLRRTWLWQYIDYRTIPTVYPPLALALFAAAALDDRNLLGVKLMAVAGEAALIGALLIVLRERGLPRGRVALYALQPLAALEFAGNAHVEAWAIAGIVVAAGLPIKRFASIAAPLALSAAVLTKIYPAMLAPLVFARNRIAFAITVTIVAAAYLPAIVGGHALGSSGNYIATQRFNASIGSLFGTQGELMTVVFTGFFGFRSVRRGGDSALAALCVVLAYLIAAPNVLPWYALVLPALLCVIPRPFALPLRPLSLGIAGWTCTVALAYGAGRFWHEGDPLGILMRCIEYVPLYAGLIATALYLRRTRLPQRVVA